MLCELWVAQHKHPDPFLEPKHTQPDSECEWDVQGQKLCCPADNLLSLTICFASVLVSQRGARAADNDGLLNLYWQSLNYSNTLVVSCKCRLCPNLKFSTSASKYKYCNWAFLPCLPASMDRQKERDQHEWVRYCWIIKCSLQTHQVQRNKLSYNNYTSPTVPNSLGTKTLSRTLWSTSNQHKKPAFHDTVLKIWPPPYNPDQMLYFFLSMRAAHTCRQTPGPETVERGLKTVRDRADWKCWPKAKHNGIEMLRREGGRWRRRQKEESNKRGWGWGGV